MPSRMTVAQRLARKLPRVRKFVRQWVRQTIHGKPTSRVVFVVGSQRSGTRLPLQLLDDCPDVVIYSEGSAPFFDRVLLRPLPIVQGLVASSMFPVVALKPICETHRLPELLNAFPQAKAIWIFRNFRDTVNSASAKWKSGREAVRRLAVGDLHGAGWRAGGLSAEKLALVRGLYHDDLSLHGANAIMWYLRNSLFFDLQVDRRRDVLLVRYESLVSAPEPMAARLYNFVGLPSPPRVGGQVYSTSIARRPFPEIPNQIERLCVELEDRLLAHFEGGEELSSTGQQGLAVAGARRPALNRQEGM